MPPRPTLQTESEPQQACLLNEHTVEAIAKEAQLSGAWLVHYSTDYVFPGSGVRPWTEEDTPAPLNVYGYGEVFDVAVDIREESASFDQWVGR